MRRIIAFLIALLTINSASPALALTKSEWDLYNLCPPEGVGMNALVALKDLYLERAERGGITKAQIQRMMENRLRAAQIYNTERTQILEIWIGLGEPQGQEFPFVTMSLHYWRQVALPTLEGHWWLVAPVWNRTVPLGRVHVSKVFIGVDAMIDHFIEEYLHAQDDERCREFRASREAPK